MASDRNVPELMSATSALQAEVEALHSLPYCYAVSGVYAWI